jgi:transposase
MEHEYSSQSIEHLGLVSAMFDELEIEKVVNQALGYESGKQIISPGQALKAMVLNGLGFAGRRLYLTSHFFENKPIESLFGNGIKASHLNDDTLGQALDDFHNYGVTELFNLIAIKSVQKLQLSPKTAHDDITSFHVDGDYNSQEPQAGEEAKGLVRISQGYSRDSKPALNQVALELICEHQAGIPIAMQALSGCENDKSAFTRSVSLHAAQLQSLGVRCVIKDSAGYTAQSLLEMQLAKQHWIMRVPNTIKAVKTWMEQANWHQQTDFKPLLEGYTYQTRQDDYGGIEQRWLLIQSQPAYLRERESTKKRLTKASQAEQDSLNAIMRLEFGCQSDAKSALEKLRKTLKYTQIQGVEIKTNQHFAQKGRPSKDQVPTRVSYQLELISSSQADTLQVLAWQGSLFVLASDDLDSKTLTDQMILLEYKGQQKVESGFGFLKDPMFLASTIFLKKVQRVMALLMVMTVCLLVYAALEFRIRQTLLENKAIVPDQKGKPTAKPTARWVFELMLDVHVLRIPHQERLITLNLKPQLRHLLHLLGSHYVEAYP